MKQINISKELVESFGYITEQDVEPEWTTSDTVGLGANLGVGGMSMTKGAVGKAAGKMATPVFIITEIYDAYKEISNIPTSTPRQQYVSQVTKIITKLVAEYGLFWVGSVMGAAIAGVFSGPGAIIGAIAGGIGGIAAYAIGGDHVDELVENIVDYFYPEGSDSVAQAKNSQSTAGIDTKLQALQKIIGAKQDGIYGPETKGKLEIWQRQQNLNPNGIPGPQTYAAARIEGNPMNNQQQITVAEEIAVLRDKLYLLENNDIEEGVKQSLGKLEKMAARRAASGEKFIPSAVDDAKIMTPAIDKEFSDAVKRLGVVEKDGKQWVKDPQNLSQWTEVEKVGNDFVRPAQSAGFNNSAWHARGPDHKELEKLLANPAATEKATAEILANPAIDQVAKEEIKKGGLAAWTKTGGLAKWVKENPGKSALIAGILGFGAGYGLFSYMNNDNPGPYPPPVPPNPNINKKKGSEALKQTQRMLNALTGSNLVIDGKWGRKTQAAYDLWKANTEKEHANIMQPLDQYHATLANQQKQQATANTSQLGSTGAQYALGNDFMKPDSVKSIEKQQFESKTVAESIAKLRDLLSAIENK